MKYHPDTYRFVDWDWKEVVNLEGLNKAVADGYTYLYNVEDTHNDSFTILASRVELPVEADPNIVQEIYDHYDQIEDLEAYEASSPKHPKYHSTHADLWDAREGK